MTYGRRSLAYRIEPVDAADPPLAVFGVPRDRAVDALFPRDERLPARLAVQLLVADAKREHLAGPGPHPQRRRHDLPVAPVAAFPPDSEDPVAPVSHGDVLALAVDVHVAGYSPRRDREMAAHAVRTEAEVAHRLERAELDRLALERLRDDRAGDVARVLARPVVVEHSRDDAGNAVRVVVVHRQEIGRDLRRRVDRLGVDRRAFVEDELAVLPVVVMVRNRLAHVAVFLGRAGRVELLELEPGVDDRLQQVQRAERVRHHRLVRAVPRLAHVRLRAEVEHIGLVGGFTQLAHQEVHRGLVREICEMHLQAVAQVPDVVQRPAGCGTHESVDVRTQRDQCVGQMRAHEAVRTGDESRAPFVELAEVGTKLSERLFGPGHSLSV